MTFLFFYYFSAERERKKPGPGAEKTENALSRAKGKVKKKKRNLTKPQMLNLSAASCQNKEHIKAYLQGRRAEHLGCSTCCLKPLKALIYHSFLFISPVIFILYTYECRLENKAAVPKNHEKVASTNC